MNPNQEYSDGKNNANTSAPVFQPVPATGFPHNPYNEKNPKNDILLHHQGLGEWSSGLCHCCSDCTSCCLTCWCPCITFGRMAEILDKGTTSCEGAAAVYVALSGSGCLYSCLYRTKLRQQYKLKEAPCHDCLVHWCCEYCALCQEYRELQTRGFILGFGWQGNMEIQNGELAMVAPTPPVMSKAASTK